MDHLLPVSVFAPAKVNLYLHITQRLKNGYHALDSLVSFADIGDAIEISEASGFSFAIDGDFGEALKGRDIDSSPQSSNLIVKAVWRLSQLVERSPNIAIRLTKNLPLGAGIGGGSSDAASVIWALCRIWNIPRDAGFVKELLASLGADVPVCFAGTTSRIRGVGDHFEPAPDLPEMPIVFVYPGKPCGTQDVFRAFDGQFREQIALPHSFDSYSDAIAFLERCGNGLLPAAQRIVPDIENALMQIDSQNGCDLARMSGSGSCCFGLFEDADAAKKAAATIGQENPDWWVRSGWLGRVERY